MVQGSGSESSDAASAHGMIGMIAEHAGDFETALTSYKRAVEIERAVHGDMNYRLAPLVDDLGRIYSQRGDYARRCRTYARRSRSRARRSAPTIPAPRWRCRISGACSIAAVSTSTPKWPSASAWTSGSRATARTTPRWRARSTTWR